jgi:CubicO group peptidase (beta-lactamase class C family)
MTIFQLLAHTAGFPGGEPLQGIKSRGEIFQAICSMDLQYKPGTKRVDDDVEYIILGFIVESVTGVTLNKYCEGRIFEPLKMSETMFAPHKAFFDRIVPTEVDPRRGGLIHGLVHDERAFVMGGVAGHAGMFTTARDLGRFSRLVMRHDHGAFAGILSCASVQLMCSRQWQDNEGEYGLGWDRLRPSYMDGIDDCDAGPSKLARTHQRPSYELVEGTETRAEESIRSCCHSTQDLGATTGWPSRAIPP